MADEAPESAAKPAPLKKGAPVAVQCDGYSYHGVLTGDDDGQSSTLEVSVLGKVARTRVTAR